MNTPTLRSLWLPAVLLVAPLLATACVDEVDQDSPVDELLFNLSEDDVQLIHDEYLAGEDFELTRARLTAPFDCSLYAGLCTQVGRDAAIVLTERQVEQALAGVPVDEISAETQAGITEASEIRRAIEAAQPDDESDDESEDVFRSSGPWAIRTKGDYRLKVRNHASHPLIGDIMAWTESKLQHQDWLGIWWAVDGTEICANTGPNDLESGYLGVQINGQYYYFLDESKDPGKHCIVGQSSHERITTHARLESVHGYTLAWRLTARGCGTGIVNGITLGICAEDHDITWTTN